MPRSLFLSAETPDCTFHVSTSWSGIKSETFKVGPLSANTSVSILKEAQAMVVRKQHPAAVGGDRFPESNLEDAIFKKMF
jgi:hypothetical protein